MSPLFARQIVVYLTWRWPIIVKALRKVHSYHFIFHTITLLHTHTQGKRRTEHWHFSFRVDEYLGMFLCLRVLVEYIEKKMVVSYLWFHSKLIPSSDYICLQSAYKLAYSFLQFCLFDALSLHYHCSLLFLDTLIYHTFPSLHDNPFGWDSNWSGCLHCHCWYPCIICTIIGRSSSQEGQLCFSW